VAALTTANQLLRALPSNEQKILVLVLLRAIEQLPHGVKKATIVL
jgi:hypothetical protein